MGKLLIIMMDVLVTRGALYIQFENQDRGILPSQVDTGLQEKQSLRRRKVSVLLRKFFIYYKGLTAQFNKGCQDHSDWISRVVLRLNSSVFVPAFYTLNKLVPETFLI